MNDISKIAHLKSLSEESYLDSSLKQQASVSLQKVKNKVSSQDESLEKVAKDFESIFLNIVLKSMRKTVNESKLFSGGHAEGLYQSMLDSEYAKIMAHTNTSELSKTIMTQLSNLKAKKSGYFSK